MNEKEELTKRSGEGIAGRGWEWLCKGPVVELEGTRDVLAVVARAEWMSGAVGQGEVPEVGGAQYISQGQETELCSKVSGRLCRISSGG